MIYQMRWKLKKSILIRFTKLLHLTWNPRGQWNYGNAIKYAMQEVFYTFSTFSWVNWRPVSVSIICSTSKISGILSLRRVSIPIFNVIVELGHDPHAPCNLRTTTRPSISCNATFPPSAIKPGLTSSKTFSTLSSVSGRPHLGETTNPAT